MSEQWGKDRERPIEFGKYRGVPWKDVPEEYLVWLINYLAEHKDTMGITRQTHSLMAREELKIRGFFAEYPVEEASHESNKAQEDI